MAAIWKLLTLLAVLLMPVGMTPASAAVAHHSTAAAMPMGDCPGQRSSHHGEGGFAECTMACAAALPAANFSSQDAVMIVCLPTQPAIAQHLHGIHPETATPPPKHS